MIKPDVVSRTKRTSMSIGKRLKIPRNRVVRDGAGFDFGFTTLLRPDFELKPNVVSRVATFDGYFMPLGFTERSGDGKLKLWSLYGMGCKIVKTLTGYVLKCKRPPSRTLNYV